MVKPGCLDLATLPLNQKAYRSFTAPLLLMSTHRYSNICTQIHAYTQTQPLTRVHTHAHTQVCYSAALEDICTHTHKHTHTHKY